MSHRGTNGRDADPPASEPGQSVLGGLVLVIFAILALWTLRDLESGGLRAIGSGGLPRAVALLIGALGLVIAVMGWRAGGHRMERVAPRPVIVILLAIAAFALTIRPWSFGAFSTPGLGLVGAGPLSVLIAGFAQRDRVWIDLGILATALTAFCMVLFGDLLALPIPVMPVSLLSHFPSWQQREVLRLLAALLVGIALVLYVLRRARRGAETGA